MHKLSACMHGMRVEVMMRCFYICRSRCCRKLQERDGGFSKPPVCLHTHTLHVLVFKY